MTALRAVWRWLRGYRRVGWFEATLIRADGTRGPSRRVPLYGKRWRRGGK